MFVLTTLVYPVVLALLCVGAGLLIDRASGRVLPTMLLPTVGMAGLIVISQLSTYVASVAPATPYLLVATALGGLVLGWGRLRALAPAWRASLWQLTLAPLAYALALAPVLLAGRPTFSSYMALADSAVHMLGADFLIRHGQDYSHLDLHNSYGATINAYYNTSYPSGADTLLGGSTFLLRLPLIWTFQPFTAFMLATATGPAWVLVRRIGLDRAWAAVATLTVTLPALVYAYELIGSVKEIVALPLIMGMGALAVEHRRWLWTGARGAIPFALLVGAGVGALGVAFGAWALTVAAVLAAVLVAELVRARGRGTPSPQETVAAWSAAEEPVDVEPRRESALEASSRQEIVPARSAEDESVDMKPRCEPALGAPSPQEMVTAQSVEAESAVMEPRCEPALGAPSWRRLAGLLAGGALVLLVGALPTWTNLSGSLSVAQGIASTSNPGNLHSPLHPTQLLGVWLGGSYKLLPTGLALTLTSILVAIGLLLAVLGLGYVVRSGRYALACWFALTILLWLLLSTYATTWADAKTLMLTSPVVVLTAWAGIAALRASPVRIAAPLVACLLVGGVLVSDALQYHESNLAPTARYNELASVNRRFAGRGPTLFTDFDEYALYELRDMDVGGPDFAYPPSALASAANGYGRPVVLDRIAPSALLAYPLIVTRRDPTAARPPAAYRLLWQGAYYQVWGRRAGAHPALAHVALSGSPGSQCAQLAGVAAAASPHNIRVSAPAGSHGTRRTTLARPHGARLVASLAPRIVTVPVPRSHLHRPAGWTRVRQRILMRRPGTLRLAFRLPHAGEWELWLKGDIMRELRVAIDGRPLGSLGGQLAGNTLVVNTLTPLRAHLAAGAHTLTITRPGMTLAPGDGGAAVLVSVFLTPTSSDEATLRAVPPARWRSLCARRLQWVELLSTP
jgi:hypothetical protein